VRECGLPSLFGWKENRRARATASVDIEAEAVAEN
jgi:hypothetical protein